MSSAARASARDTDATQRAKRRQREERERAAASRTPEPGALVSGAGQPLDPSVRRELEEQLGHDLSRVRLHTDRDSGALTELLGADAVAVGPDIFFREGAYQPGTSDGRRLLAHEVLHTIQNPHGLGTLRAGRGLGAVSLPQDAAEREAETAAQQVLRLDSTLGGDQTDAKDVEPGQATPGWLRYATVDADRGRAEQLDPATLVERLTRGVMRSLRGDPGDRSGRARLQLSRMSPGLRDAVLDLLELRLTTHEHNRLIDLVEETEAQLPAPAEAAATPEAVPDLIDEIVRQHLPEGWDPPKADGTERDADQDAGDGAQQDQPAAATSTGKGAAGQGARREESDEESAPGQQEAERQEREHEEKEQDAQAEEESEEEDAQAEKEEEQDSEAREAREEEEREEEEERDGESVEEGEEREAENDAALDDELREDETDADRDEPSEDEEPLGLDPGADSDPNGPSPDASSGAESTEEEDSAWNVELEPDDFLPATDLDLSAVPTADQIPPGSASEPSIPSFPEPPATKAEQVKEEREKEADQDNPEAEAEADAEAESGGGGERADNEAAPAATDTDAEGEQTADDLRTEQSLEQEVGPDPGQDDATDQDPQSLRRPDSGTPQTSDSGTGTDGSPRPTSAVSVPDRAETSTDRAQALGGVGAARFAGPASGPAPTVAHDATRAEEFEGGIQPPTPDTPSAAAESEKPQPEAPQADEPSRTPAATASVSGAEPATDSSAEDGSSDASATSGDNSQDDEAPAAHGSRAATATPSGVGGGSGGSGGSGGGSGGAAAKKQQATKAPNLAKVDPEAGLSTAASLTPHLALEAMGSVNESVGTSVGKEEQALADSPPTTERPAGSPETLSGDPTTSDPGQYTDEDASEVDSPEEEEAEVEGSTEPEGDIPGEDFDLSTADKWLAGGAQVLGSVVNGVSNFFGGGDVIDTDSLVQSIVAMPTEDEALAQAEVGTAPGVEMSEETNEATDEQSDNLDETDAQLHEEGVEDSEQNLGEDQIYPDVPQETMTGTVAGSRDRTATGPASASGGGDTGEVPAEAVSEVAEHERAPQLKTAFKQGQRDMTGERETKDQDYGESQRKHEHDVQSEIDTNTRVQSEERDKTVREVSSARTDWREEQDGELDEIENDKGEQYRTVRADIKEKEEDTDEDVEEKQEDEDHEIEQKDEKATEDATEERDDAEKESGNWLSEGIDWILDKLRALRDAIVDAFVAARNAIIDLINDFVTTVLEWIESARQFVVELFEAFVEALVALGRAFLEALQEIANRIREFVIALRDAAIALVNQLAEALHQMVQGLLDAITEALSTILAALKRGLEMAIELVETMVQAVMDFAKGLLTALGQWMQIAVDIITDPGGWIGNAASSAETGAREHLFTETQAAVKEWFNQKIQEILGLPQETFELLLNGGMSKEEIVEEAWAAVLPQLPMIIGELVITKVVAKLIPGAGWAMAIVEALQVAFGALSEILRAFGLFMDYLKSVKGGNAANPFAKAVAAGVVALLEIIYELLMSGIGKYVGKVGDRLKGVASGLRNKGPDKPDTDERKEQGEETNEAKHQTNKADEELNSTSTQTTSTSNSSSTSDSTSTSSSTSSSSSTSASSGGSGSGSTSTKSKSGGSTGGTPGGKSNKGGTSKAPRNTRPPHRNDATGPGGGNHRRNDGSDNRRSDNDTDRRNDQDSSSTSRREVDGPKKTTTRRKPSPAGRAQKRAKQTVKAALARTRRAKRALGRKNRDSKIGKRLDNRARRTRNAYKNRRDQLRRQQKTRQQQRQQRRDQRNKKENSKESKAERLRKIVARIRPQIQKMLHRGTPEDVFHATLLRLKAWHRLTRLTATGTQDFDLIAALNPQALVTQGEFELFDLGNETPQTDQVRREIQRKVGSGSYTLGDLVKACEGVERDLFGAKGIEKKRKPQSQGKSKTKAISKKNKGDRTNEDSRQAIKFDPSKSTFMSLPERSFPDTIIVYHAFSAKGKDNQVAIGHFKQAKNYHEIGKQGDQTEYKDTHGKSYVLSSNGSYVPRFVERNLSDLDSPKASSRGIDAGNPAKPVSHASVAEHVQGAPTLSNGRKNSPFISTTKKNLTELTNAQGESLGGEHGSVRIDLLQVSPGNILDLTSPRSQKEWSLDSPRPGRPRQALQDVVRTQEVLIVGHIPAAAIVKVRP